MTELDRLKADFVYWVRRYRLTPAQYEIIFDEICPEQAPIDYATPPPLYEYMSCEAALDLIQRRAGVPQKAGLWWNPRHYPKAVREAELALERNEISIAQYSFITHDQWTMDYINRVSAAVAAVRGGH